MSIWIITLLLLLILIIGSNSMPIWTMSLLSLLIFILIIIGIIKKVIKPIINYFKTKQEYYAAQTEHLKNIKNKG